MSTLTKDPVTCKRHKWEVIGESKPVMVRSNLRMRFFRWYEPVKCTVCGTTKTRPA